MRIKRSEVTFISIVIQSISMLLIAGGERLSVLEKSWTLKTRLESRWILRMCGHQHELPNTSLHATVPGGA